MTEYLQHTRDWTITLDAIVGLSARHGHAFTYAELAREIEEHDGLSIDGRAYAGALNAVAEHVPAGDPMWTVMVVNAETLEPGEGFWQASYRETKYRVAKTLTAERRKRWLAAQQAWCVAAARRIEDPIALELHEAEISAREQASEILTDLLLAQGRDDGPPVNSTGRIGLVSCTKSKVPTAAPAKELYMASSLFQGQRSYVERTCDRWFILSAKYGLVDPDQVIEPYEESLKTQGTAGRRAWADEVLGELDRRLGGWEGVTFECHAGSPYLDFGLVQGINRRGGLVERPTRGLRMGQQLAFYAGGTFEPPRSVLPVPPQPDVQHEQVSQADRRAVVDALLAFGSTLESGDLIALGPDPESDRLIREDPFAFLLGVIFDQGIRYERAWRAPYDLLQRLGSIDPAFIVANAGAVNEAVARPPALHRYVNNMASWVVAAADRVLSEYGGEADRIWNDEPSAELLRRRLEAFTGIGQKKAAMAVEILERQRGVPITHLEGSDIAFDVHVRRVFLRSGLADRDEQRHMVEAARALNPERPGELDYPAWWIGHEWCHPNEPLCASCPLRTVCPQLVHRAISVI